MGRSAAVSHSRLDTFLESAFRIRPGEARRVGLMFVYVMSVVSTFIVGRTVRDTLFLSRYDLEHLPLMYVAVAPSVSIAAFAYARVTDRYRRDKVIITSLSLSCGALAVVWGLIFSELVGPWVYPTLYVLVEIVGGLAVIQFWTFANDIFSSREAKRLFGIIGAGGVISNVIVGFAIRGAVKAVGAENLLLVCIILLITCIWSIRAVAKDATAELEIVSKPWVHPGSKAATSSSVFSSKHIKLIAATVAVTVLTVTIVDYQFKAIAKHAFEGREADLAAYFGTFYGFTGIVACVIQFFITGWLLERKGIVVALLLLPTVLVLGASAMLFAVPLISVLTAATMTKGAENVLRYTLNDSTVQLLYTPVPAHQRGRAKAFIDGMLKPTFVGLSGLAIYGLQAVLPEKDFAVRLGWLGLVLGAVWLTLVFSIRSEYVRSLLSTLRSRRLDLDSSFTLRGDETTAGVLRASLDSDREVDVLHALELIPGLDGDMHDAVAPLLDHMSAPVRITTLRLLQDAGRLKDLDRIEVCFGDEVEAVRAAAVQAYCALGGNQAIQRAVQFVRDESPVVRGAAITGLISHGGLDGILTAGGSLTELLKSDDPAHRKQGAKVLASIGVKTFYQPVLELLNDPDPGVRLAGIDAAAAMKSKPLVPSLVYKLSQRDTARAAARALAGYGPDLEPLLLKVLDNEGEDRAVRMEVPAILAKVGTGTAFRCLLEGLENADADLATNMAKAASRLRERVRDMDIDDQVLVAAISRAIRAAYQTLATIEDLELADDDLLSEALLLRHKKYVALAFRILEIRYPSHTIRLVYANLDSENKRMRANAIEVIDNLVSKEEARLLLPLIEDHSRAVKLRYGAELFDLERLAPEVWIGQLLQDRNAWTVATTLDLIGRHGRHSLLESISGHLAAADPVVRESACVCAQRLLDAPPAPKRHQALTSLAQKATEDDSPIVRRAGSSLLTALDAIAT